MGNLRRKPLFGPYSAISTESVATPSMAEDRRNPGVSARQATHIAQLPQWVLLHPTPPLFVLNQDFHKIYKMGKIFLILFNLANLVKILVQDKIAGYRAK